VFRSPYNGPLHKQVRRFDDGSVLAWARRVWKPLPRERAFEYARELLSGLKVYSFGNIFNADQDRLVGPPNDIDDGAEVFVRLYWPIIEHGPHHLHLLTDDDDNQMAIYLFDDQYRRANPGKTDFLLHEGWDLPHGEAESPAAPLPDTYPLGPRGDGE